MWIIPDTRQTFTKHSDIRSAFPDVSLPATITDDDLSVVGVYPVTVEARPGVDKLHQELSLGAPESTEAGWAASWGVRELSADERTAATALYVADLAKDLAAHFDKVASEKRYDSRLSCAVRAGYAGPYQFEGAAFGTWMDACNVIAYGVFDSIHAGASTSFNELLALLPVIEWP